MAESSGEWPMTFLDFRCPPLRVNRIQRGDSNLTEPGCRAEENKAAGMHIYSLYTVGQNRMFKSKNVSMQIVLNTIPRILVLKLHDIKGKV